MSPVTPPSRSILFHLAHLHRLTNPVFLERISHLEITAPMHRILFEVGAEREEVTSSELARRTYVSPQTVNLVVQRLEERGLVERTPTGHSRGLALSLTAEGEAMLAELQRIHRTVVEETFAGTSVDERQLEGMLRELIDSAQDRFGGVRPGGEA